MRQNQLSRTNTTLADVTPYRSKKLSINLLRIASYLLINAPPCFGLGCWPSSWEPSLTCTAYVKGGCLKMVNS